MTCYRTLSHFLKGENISQVQIVLEEHREDNSILPARVSAHTENVHFLKTDEEHFYLKVITQWCISEMQFETVGAQNCKR